MINTMLTWKKQLFNHIFLQALRKSIIKRNCTLYDNNNKYIIYADEQYKIAKTKITNDQEREEMKNNVSCRFYCMFEVRTTVRYNKRHILVSRNCQCSKLNELTFQWNIRNNFYTLEISLKLRPQ